MGQYNWRGAAHPTIHSTNRLLAVCDDCMVVASGISQIDIDSLEDGDDDVRLSTSAPKVSLDNRLWSW